MRSDFPINQGGGEASSVIVESMSLDHLISRTQGTVYTQEAASGGIETRDGRI